jgi:hypothetical protein
MRPRSSQKGSFPLRRKAGCGMGKEGNFMLKTITIIENVLNFTGKKS